MLQRDAFIREVVRALPAHPEIIFLSADFGAEALDALRADFPAQFLHCGICEQAMVDVATGLALEGHSVFVYAMAPFVSLRALEQVKCGPGVMQLPITLLSVGIGLGYADAGPTHYATEDFACLRTISGLNIYTTSDAPTATALAHRVIARPELSYIRLDRHALPDLAPACGQDDLARGWRLLGGPVTGRVALVSHGRPVHDCVALAAAEPDRLTAIDLIRSKPFPESLAHELAGASRVVVIDEQTPNGSLPAAVWEACREHGHHVEVTPVTLPDRYISDNGGRWALLGRLGLAQADILKATR